MSMLYRYGENHEGVIDHGGTLRETLAIEVERWGYYALAKRLRLPPEDEDKDQSHALYLLNMEGCGPRHHVEIVEGKLWLKRKEMQ